MKFIGWTPGSEFGHKRIEHEMTCECNIEVTRAEAEDKTTGLTVAQIDILSENNMYCRVWVSVSIKNGRPKIVVAQNGPLGTTLTNKKILSGTWREKL
jgi:gamma-glutamylcyclotransferase (GGCT)/AIG2-like uncharacterized protein YtfP